MRNLSQTLWHGQETGHNNWFWDRFAIATPLKLSFYSFGE
jgi:hypothetical protein